MFLSLKVVFELLTVFILSVGFKTVKISQRVFKINNLFLFLTVFKINLTRKIHIKYLLIS